MAEEQRCQASESHRLCANNCGFFGSPTTLDLCSKCYRDLCLKEEQASSSKIILEQSFAGIPPTNSSSSFIATTEPEATAILSSPITTVESTSKSLPNDLPSAQPNRCATCRKRVGLSGFRCRCDITFCGSHRYPEQHSCTFDFKGEGRKEIARANPIIKAEKLRKI